MLARILAPQDFGLVALATLATQLLGIVTDLGLTSALIQRDRLDDEDLSTGFWLALASSTTLAVAGIASAPLIGELFGEPRIVPLLRVMFLTLPISALGQVPDAMLQRKLDFRRVAHIDWMTAIVSGGIGVGAALAGYGLWALVAQFVSAALISAALRQLMVRWRPIMAFNPAVARSLVGYGSSLVAVGLVNYATATVDNAIIGGRIGAAALGYYMLAYNLVLLPATNVGGLVSRVMFPALASLQSDSARFLKAYVGMLRIVAVITFPLIVGLGVTAPVAIPVIYGPQWGTTVILLQILTTVGIFQAVNVCGVVYSAIGRPQLLLGWATLSLTIMTVAFTVGSRWGVTGVAWSYLAVISFVFLPPHIVANRLIGLAQREFLRIVGEPLAAGLIMGAIVLVARQSPWVYELALVPQLLALVVIGSVAYVCALFALAYVAGAGRDPFIWITTHRIPIAAGAADP